MFQRIETAISPNSLGALLFATLLVVLATLLRLALEGATSLVFVTYYPAILVISLLCGFAVSVFAIALSMLAAWGLLIAPNFELSGLSGTAVFNLFFFAAISLSIAAIGDSRRTLLRRVRVDEERARLLLEELRHRTKNAYTVVQAVISQSMSDKDEAKEALNRIKSLAAMDDLLGQSHNQMVSLQAIAEQRLHAFGDRASIQGPPLDLNSSLAKVTVLILHELATNALKYGSLSQPEGRVILTWDADGAVHLKWREMGGPTVTRPGKPGSGLALNERLVNSVGGSISVDFASEGVRYEVSLPLPERIITPVIVL